MSSEQSVTSENNDTITNLPTENTVMQATKLSLKIGRPICYYFYNDSYNGDVKICTDGKEKIIFKNLDEHTSTISNIYKVDRDLLILTSNTVYVISANTKVAKMPEELLE
jgi:hypothetical protein